MSRECFTDSCNGNLKVIGVAGRCDDMIEVECEKCGEIYELEPDGLGEGGMEWVEAMMIKEAEENE